jgi:hypothetical protein
MTRELREVWVVVYEPFGTIDNIAMSERLAEQLRTDPKHVLKRLPLLTDADRKVLEAAEAMADTVERLVAQPRDSAALDEKMGEQIVEIHFAVRARRAAMDHVADAGKKGDA